MRVLGLSAYFHDSAACIVDDAGIAVACHEERFSRRKHDASFPRMAIAACLEASPGAIDAVAFYEKPLLKFERAMTTIAARAPHGRRAFVDHAQAWFSERLRLPEALREVGIAAPVSYVEHHESHAGSAFLPSPFESAAVLVADGVGEWATNTLWSGEGDRLTALREIRFPHSLGLLYSAITELLGFEVLEDEYKVMGLAPYGTPRFAQALLDEVIDLRDDGSYRLNLSYFAFMDGERTASPALAARLGLAPRAPESPLTDEHRDLARSIQHVTEEVLLRQARFAARETGQRHLCLAGGVALNCVANGRVLREGPFESLYIQPASGDAGGAVGAALVVAHRRFGRPRVTGRDGMRGACLGTSFTPAAVDQALADAGLEGELLDDAALYARVASALDGGAVVGWARGREEFGPRALGARSILADPRSAGMRDRVNAKIKFREGFRPFAPAVLAEAATEWFTIGSPSPYMLLAGPVRTDRVLPAVTHVDGSARVQTVDVAQHPDFHALIAAFAARTGCPVVLNTSFNLRGEPIVSSPADACRTFLASEMDVLVVGNRFVARPTPAPAPLVRAAVVRASRPRRFALGILVPVLVVAGVVLVGGHRVAASVLTAIVFSLGVISELAVKHVEGLERRVRPFAEAAARVQGRVLSSIAWALVVVPIGLLRRGSRRELLAPRDAKASTYWLDCRRPQPGPERYERMF